MVVLIQYSRPISKSNILFTIITNQTSKFRLSSENTNIPKGRRKPKRSGWKPPRRDGFGDGEGDRGVGTSEGMRDF